MVISKATCASDVRALYSLKTIVPYQLTKATSILLISTGYQDLVLLWKISRKLLNERTTCPFRSLQHMLNNKFGFAILVWVMSCTWGRKWQTILTSSLRTKSTWQSCRMMEILSYITKKGQEKLSTHTTGKTDILLAFQLDGHVCLKDERTRQSAWCSGYFKNQMCHRCQCTLILKDDGSLTAYKGNIDPTNKYWASKYIPFHDE